MTRQGHAPTEQTRGPGRPPFEPTPEQRRTVEAMCAYGIPQEEIAAVVGIAHTTLRKYFRHEIDTATAKANAKIAEGLYRMATQGEDLNVASRCSIFWLKTRAKWSERVEVGGPDGGAIPVGINVVFRDPGS